MDRIQFDLACQIVDLDCIGQGRLKDGKGNLCAIGGLYAVIDPDWAVSPDIDNNRQETHHYEEVAEVFGIETSRIFLVNDRHKDLDKRRAAVKVALAAQLEDE